MTPRVILRDVTQEDLPILFEQQLDPEANRTAAFTSRDPNDRTAFMMHWEKKILGDPAVTKRAIIFENRLAGSILSFDLFGKLSVAYWLGREFWGKGIATAALAEFLRIVRERPIGARAAKDNVASLRVLEKCGFAICGSDKGFANGRGEEIEEYILELKGEDHG